MEPGKGGSSSEAAGKASKPLNVLVVEDNPTIQSLHKMLLNKLGIANQTVGNGKEAVDLHSSGMAFDLILMDMEMPIMDGPEATKALRGMGVRSKIVGVSAHSKEEAKQAFIEAGLDGFCEKPLSRSKLVSILKVVDDSI